MPPFLAALLLVLPLTSDQGWHMVAFRGLPAHEVRFGGDGLTVRVDRSASAIVYPLASVTPVHFLRASGRVRGTLDVSADRQGERGFDDYALRVGLVEAGGRPPGFFQRRFAPEWLRMLLDMAPRGIGIASVRFFNLGTAPAQIGQSRRHPLSDLLHERVVAAADADGRFEIDVRLEAPVETMAVWINVDGDDTGSRFTVTIEHLALGGFDAGSRPARPSDGY